MSPLRLRLLACTPLIACLAAGAGAFPFFPELIPNGTVNRCANCHIDPAGGGPRTEFGLAFSENGFSWDDVLATLDSDGDSFTNGEELQDAAGTWAQGADQPGNPLLVSSPGWDFSTPGQRGVAISEVRTLPSAEQAIEFSNRLEEPFDAAGLILFSGEEGFTIPLGASGETTIPGLGSIVVWVNSPVVPPGCALCEPVSGGLAPLGQTDFVALHWIADDAEHFDVSQTMVDYVQWGEDGQPRESVAADAGQWERGLAAPAPISGESLVWDGIGDGVMAWHIDHPSLGESPPGMLFPAVLQALLGLRPIAPVHDTNADGSVDAADLVTTSIAISGEL